MFRLISLKLWVSAIAYLALAGGPLSTWALEKLANVTPALASKLSPLISSRTTVLVVWAVLALILWKPIWRLIWRLPLVGSWLSRAVFPDLNGSWQVEIQSNWPIIDAMRNAAKSPRGQLDVLDESVELPELQHLEFRATIDQRWFSTEMTLEATPESILKTSKTLCVELLPASEIGSKGIVLTFKQHSKSPRVPTDEQTFLGSALLSVMKDGTLDGVYWTNRSWDRGLNSAGLIVMRRTSI